MTYVLIVVLDKTGQQVLLMKKNRGPDCAIDKFNCPGGKVKDDESYDAAAIRKLAEETGIIRESLVRVVDERFPDNTYLAVYCTQLVDGEDFQQLEDEPLMWYWINVLTDVTNKFLAGYGNLPYFIHFAKMLLS